MRNFNPKEGSITKNLKVIEWLKSELLTNVSLLFRVMIENSEEKILDVLSNIIMVAYLLASRLGYSFDKVDRRVKNNLEANIKSRHQIEKWYGDLSELLEHIEDGG